jgi:hypothetical protein
MWLIVLTARDKVTGEVRVMNCWVIESQSDSYAYLTRFSAIGIDDGRKTNWDHPHFEIHINVHHLRD